MSVKIEYTSSPAPSDTLIIVPEKNFSGIEEAGLSKKEATFVRNFFKNGNGKKDLFIINQYDRYVFITRPVKGNDHTEKEKFRQAGSKISAYMKLTHLTRATILNQTGQDEWALALAEGVALSAYEFIKYLTDSKDKVVINRIAISGVDKKEVANLNHVVSAVYTARDLANEPVNKLTAVNLSERIAHMAKDAGFRFEYFNKKKIESLKMGGLLAVNKASHEPPTFNILEYKHPKAVNKKPIVFVGKGVVFDTGGVSLKSAAGMDKMKCDMSGAAAVAAAIYGIAKSQLKVHVIGLIPATDNRIGSHAIVPGDIITMYSGKTVEVLNTDAEGRLILGDALHYAKKFKPAVVIDLATLTGAAMMAVGEFGMVSMEKNAGDAYQLLEKCGENVYERLVKFPLWEEYDDLLKSQVADLKNIGGPQAGAITAGKFLEHFTDFPWIHIDLSNAIIDKQNHYRSAGGTGAGTRLLIEFARQIEKNKQI